MTTDTTLTADAALDVLRAVAEPTRLRLVALLAQGELSVSDLCDICGQSQPRISRHVKLLADAGVIERHREGTWVYCSLVGRGPTRQVVNDVLAAIDPADPSVAADRERLAIVRRRRSDSAQLYFANVAAEWDRVRSLHAPDATVEAAIVGAATARPFASILDVGTGTGRMLQLLAEHAERVVGLDSSHSMLAVARANLDRAAIGGVELRQGDVLQPSRELGLFDLVVIHQVLHYLDDPASAVAQAAALVAPGGRLLICDFAAHGLEFLRSEHAHRRLGFRDDTIEGWLGGAGLAVSAVEHVPPHPRAGSNDPGLTVSIWIGTDVTLPDHHESKGAAA